MNEFLKLNFNAGMYIIWSSELLIQELHLCDDIIINLHINNVYNLAEDCLQYNLFILRDMLQDAIKNLLQKHNSIKEDIGLIWNKDLHNEEGLVYDESEGQQFWVGLRNLVWSTPGSVRPVLSTWLYNDKDGNIILEVTPSYPWHFDEPNANENDYISYEEFIQSYKPLLITQISKDVACQWLEQIETLLKIVKADECSYETNN